jgi:TM2 domain-containing membrane protein YozV
MNCTVHPESAATAYCRTCGKAMCDACKHTVHGVIYCEDCLATRVNQPGATTAAIPVIPAAAGPSPALAFFLGFIPGVGAMYNGQFIKGLIHVVVFATLIMAENAGLSDGADAFVGLMIAFWVFYMVFDAYKTAKAHLYGQPAPDPFGIERTFGGPQAAVAVAGPPAGAPPVGAYAPGTPLAPMYIAPAQEVTRQPSPVGAIVLIALGVLFLLNSFGWLAFHWLHRMWPLILIGLGVWLFIRRFGTGDPTPRQE